MDKQTAIRMFEARKTSIEGALKTRSEGKNDFSNWRLTSDEKLEGILFEVKNVLNILNFVEGN